MIELRGSSLLCDGIDLSPYIEECRFDPSPQGELCVRLTILLNCEDFRQFGRPYLKNSHRVMIPNGDGSWIDLSRSLGSSHVSINPTRTSVRMEDSLGNTVGTNRLETHYEVVIHSIVTRIPPFFISTEELNAIMLANEMTRLEKAFEEAAEIYADDIQEDDFIG